MLTFDEAALRVRLAQLGRIRAAAWAAACAERLMKYYGAIDAAAARATRPVLRAARDRLWSGVAAAPDPGDTATAEERACEVVASSWSEVDVPGQWIAGQTIAEDVAAAVAYALRGWRTGDSAVLALAGRRAHDLAAAIHDAGAASDGEFSGADVRRIQHELQSQENDLRVLTDEAPTAVAVRAVRSAAAMSAGALERTLSARFW